MNTATFPLRILAVMALLVLSSICGHAERLAIRTYSISDGLARDSVLRVVQDSRGVLWFCTAEGLSRFDGHAFVNYGREHGLPHRAVQDILETASGVFLIATRDGIALLDANRPPPGNGSLTDLVKPQKEATQWISKVFRSERSGASVINKLFKDSLGTIWVGTADGLYRLELSSDIAAFRKVDLGLPANVPAIGEVFSIIEDQRGALWIGAERGLYRRWPNGQVDMFLTEQALTTDGIRSITIDRAGTLWVATRAGLYRIMRDAAPERDIVERFYTVKDGLASNDVYAVLSSQDGKIWVATSKGLSVIIPGRTEEPAVERTYTKFNGLSDDGLQTLYEDRDGNIWIGSESGAMKIAFNGITTFGATDGLTNTRIASILQDKSGQLYVITANGQEPLNLFDGKQFSRVPLGFPKGVAQSWGWFQISFQDREGDWWIPTNKGLYRHKARPGANTPVPEPYAIYTTNEGLTGDEVFRLYEDVRGDIWISTLTSSPDSLCRWERSTGKIHKYPSSQGLPKASPTAFAEDPSGNLWIGFYDGSLARYRNGKFSVFGRSDGLPEGLIRSIYRDRTGRIWVATASGGALRIQDVTVEHPQFIALTASQGLSSNQVTSITEDQFGRLYFGTGRGLNRYDPQTGTIRWYSMSDGLADNFVNASFRDNTGALWFGTLQGLSRLVPERERGTSDIPVYISAVKLGDSELRLPGLGVATVPPVELSPDENRIQIDFLSVMFTSDVNFDFLLEGGSAGWTPLPGQRTLTLANLAPGSYKLLIRAHGSDGQVSASPAVFSFKVLPPVWRRWWFLGIIGLVIASVLITLERYRAARIRELNNALSISTQLTQELKEQQAELYHANRAIELDAEVTRILAEADSLTSSAPNVIRVICEREGWECGAIWSVDREASILRCVEFWHKPSLPVPGFERITRETVLGPGEGLPGRVWKTCETRWIADIRTGADFPRFSVAVNENLQSAFGFPLLLENEVLGVMEFFSSTTRRPDQGFVESISGIGAHLGQLIERRRAEEALRESESRFRTLAETASDAIITINTQGRILFVNNAAERIFGYSRGEMLDGDLKMLVPNYSSDQGNAVSPQRFETGHKHFPWEAVELSGVHKSGREIPLEISLGVWFKQGEKFFTAIARDTTERRRIEEEVRNAREERFRELERVRRRIATDLHDDIGSSLTQISILSEVLSQKIGDGAEDVLQPLELIAGASRELIDSMSDIVWAINPQKDHLSDLVHRMRRFATDVFTAKEINFRFIAPESEVDVQLGANIRREIFLIFKESINNAVKHSGCTETEVKFTLDGEMLSLEVSDNGGGFEPSVLSNGNGLSNMKDRARGLGGVFLIWSNDGSSSNEFEKGTTISLNVPLVQPNLAPSHKAISRN